MWDSVWEGKTWIHENFPWQAKKQLKVVRMGEGDRTGQALEAGQAKLRLCNLVAQSGHMPKEDFKKAVEKELTGPETEPWEIVYLKLYQSQMPS